IRWTIGKLIGQGAFGRVFLGLNMDSGELMAVKQVMIGAPAGSGSAYKHPNLSGTDMDSQRKKREDALKREIELLQELDHENIVRYLGFEVKDKTFNVLLEYVSGGSIASVLAKFGKFEEDLARFMTMQILYGLEYLHSVKIIHRDIKGANILVDADGIAKISDFGISKKNEYAVAYQRMTRMSMQGSIYWMAPEVARGKGYSAKVDIWSLGCLVLEMLTGNHPWHKVRGNIIYALGTGNKPPVPDTLGPIARDFLALCFTIDPEKRPTATDLISHPF
ncbi:kinase-like domain-containing protein, partial [Cladochytrium replicatum]